MTARKKQKGKGKQREFSKKLAIWAAAMATLSAAASYILAASGREAVSDVTSTIFTACIGYLITYAGKSLGEKVSRNKHHLDANGKPLPEKNTSNDEEILG